MSISKQDVGTVHDAESVGNDIVVLVNKKNKKIATSGSPIIFLEIQERNSKKKNFLVKERDGRIPYLNFSR